MTVDEIARGFARMVDKETAQRTVKALTDDLINKMMCFANREWGDHFLTSLKDADGRLKLKVVYGINRQGRSRGGRKRFTGWTSLALGRYVRCYQLASQIGRGTVSVRICEYDHILADPEIGGGMSVDWTIDLGRVIAHELAHVICHCSDEDGQRTFADACDKPYRGRYKMERVGHGADWQHVYRVLRNKFVNGVEKFELPKLPEKRKYEKKKLTREKKFRAVKRDGVTFYFAVDTKFLYGYAVPIGLGRVRAFDGERNRLGLFDGVVAARHEILKHHGVR